MDGGEAGQRAGEVGVIRAEELLLDLDDPPDERLGLPVIVDLQIKGGEIRHVVEGVGMRLPQVRDVALQGLPRWGDGLSVPPHVREALRLHSEGHRPEEPHSPHAEIELSAAEFLQCTPEFRHFRTPFPGERERDREGAEEGGTGRYEVPRLLVEARGPAVCGEDLLAHAPEELALQVEEVL